MLALKDCFICRNNASKKTNHQEISKSAKLKEPDVGESSSPAVAKQLEFTPKPVPVIKTSTKKVFIQPPAFGDTEASIGTKAVFPHWGEIFQKIKREEFPEYTPHNDPDMRKLDDEVFLNIQRSYLHMVARRTPVFPCIELLKWLIDHTDTQICLINDDNGECVRVFLPVEVQNYYKLRDPEERLNTDFVVSFYEKHNTNKVMASWWREDKKFTNRTSDWYPTTNLRDSYIYLMALICQVVWGEILFQVFRGMDASSLHVAISGRGFNWGAIISKAVEHLHSTGPDAERGRNPILLHGFLFIGCHLCQKCLCRNELELAHLRTPGPCIFQHLVGEQVQEILLSHLRSIYHTYSFYDFQERVPKTVSCGQKDDIKGWSLVPG
jgi:hypothetical protein